MNGLMNRSVVASESRAAAPVSCGGELGRQPPRGRGRFGHTDVLLVFVYLAYRRRSAGLASEKRSN
jgi:hypothetical protein